MMLAVFLAAAVQAAPAPVVHYAEARSIAYRNCVAAEKQRRPALSVAQIGRGACAGTRSKLLSEARSHVSYGWRPIPRSAGQAKRLRAQLKINAEQEVVRFEGALQAWLGATESNGGGQ